MIAQWGDDFPHQILWRYDMLRMIPFLLALVAILACAKSDSSVSDPLALTVLPSAVGVDYSK